jgi:hypothetical protein
LNRDRALIADAHVEQLCGQGRTVAGQPDRRGVDDAGRIVVPALLALHRNLDLLL